MRKLENTSVTSESPAAQKAMLEVVQPAVNEVVHEAAQQAARQAVK